MLESTSVINVLPMNHGQIFNIAIAYYSGQGQSSRLGLRLIFLLNIPLFQYQTQHTLTLKCFDQRLGPSIDKISEQCVR